MGNKTTIAYGMVRGRDFEADDEDRRSVSSSLRYQPVRTGSRWDGRSPSTRRRASLTQMGDHLPDRTTQQNIHFDDDEYDMSYKRSIHMANAVRWGAFFAGRGKNFYLGLGMGGTLLLVVAFCMITTWGFALWDTHMSDPRIYGPMRGVVVYGVFGGGDSQSQPSRVMSTNDEGRVYIIKFASNDPSKATVLLGPDLKKMGFPDSLGANVALEIADINKDGNLDIRFTVLATVYDYPLHRYSHEYVLYGDGNGNLKQGYGQ